MILSSYLNEENLMKLRDMFSVVVVATLALLWLGGCKPAANSGTVADDPQPGQTVNLVCPITGNLVAVGKEVPTRNLGQKTVGFCCTNCPAQWDALSDADKKARLKTAMEKQSSMVVNPKCPIMGTPVNKAIEMRIYDGKIIGFCCAGCPAQWDKLSDADKKAKFDAAMK